MVAGCLLADHAKDAVEETMVEGHKDYSATPLWKKLGIHEGSRVLLIGAPPGFDAMFHDLPDGVSFLARPRTDLDVVVWFVTERTDLAKRLGGFARRLEPDGRLWVAWPKKASGVPTDIGFEDVQGIGLAGGLVDNKSASVTEVFQGVQFVYRLKDRGP
jgi:hypothetical protein